MTTGSTGGQNYLGGRYRMLRELGRGGFGCTYLAEDINRFNELCVLKEFFPQVNDAATLQKAKQLFEREAGILYQLNHPQIPRFRELLRVQTADRGQLFLVQDYVEGPTYQALLETRLRSGSRFSEAEVIQLLQNLLPVLDYIHHLGVIHRDITPDNLILRNADGLPVLIDFGGVKKLVTAVERQVGTEIMHTRLGKVGYAPQEQLESGEVTPSADLYSLAVTALVLLTGEYPQALYDRDRDRWHWQRYTTVSPQLARILGRMLSLQPGERYSTAAAAMNDIHGLAASPQQFSAVPVEPTRAVAPGGPNTPTMAAASTPAGAASTVSRTASSRQRPPAQKSRSVNGCLQALGGLALLLGAIGLVWWIASRWEPTGTLSESPEVTNSEAAAPSDGLSQAEQARREALRQRQASLQVDNRFLVQVADQLFYTQFPDMQGRAITDAPEDEAIRTAWNQIANEVLDTLEAHLSEIARRALGSYTATNREQWRQRVNQQSVGSRSLNDLADAKFAYLYPQYAVQDFIDQPIGQIWHGLADDRVRAIESGERLEDVRFEPGSFSRSLRDRLEPGEGRVYTLNLQEGQLLRLSLQAAPESVLLSLYVPVPTEEIPFLLEDSPQRTWSGQLPQSGYYEVTVVSTQASLINYALDISVDNVTSAPVEEEPAQVAPDGENGESP